MLLPSLLRLCMSSTPRETPTGTYRQKDDNSSMATSNSSSASSSSGDWSEEEPNPFDITSDDNGGSQSDADAPSTSVDQQTPQSPVTRQRPPFAAGQAVLPSHLQVLSAGPFKVTVFNVEEVPYLRRQEVQDLVDNHINVVTETGCGPDGQLSKRMQDGLKHPHGWLVIARLNQPVPGIADDTMVGALLVTAETLGQWEPTQHRRRGREVEVRARVTHMAYVKHGVQPAMWAALMNRFREDSDRIGNLVTISVRAGGCINTPELRQFYQKQGIFISDDTTMGQPGFGTYNKGVPQ
tara:strand:+ start:1681 stop:2565 length:885 start_codon:yes stop_codon:yes gene_type:complete